MWIIFGFNSFFVLKISVTSSCKFLWWIVTDLSLISNSENVHYNLYRLPSRCVRVDYFTIIHFPTVKHPISNGQYPNWEQMNAFIIDLGCARFIYCATFVRAFSYCEAFLHKKAAWSSKWKLLSKRIPKSFLFELLLIVSFLTLILILPVVFTSRWHLLEFALR